MSIVRSPAIDAFAEALGADKVITGEEELAEWRDPFRFEAWTDYSASAVVMPTTLPQPRSATDSMSLCPPDWIAS